MTDCKHLSIRQKANYYTLGTLQKNTKQVWIVLHGYGQLARYFIRKFAKLVEYGHLIIAPEAMSRFYLDGSSGRVGASWMTKENRQTDIDNYIEYLDSLLTHIDIPQNVKVNVIGFSQGAATASRWIAEGNTQIDRLILWAGIFPPDMNIHKSREKFQKLENITVYGTKDEYFSNKKLEEHKFIESQLGTPCKLIRFEDTHDIHTETLMKIAQE